MWSQKRLFRLCVSFASKVFVRAGVVRMRGGTLAVALGQRWVHVSGCLVVPVKDYMMHLYVRYDKLLRSRVVDNQMFSPLENEPQEPEEMQANTDSHELQADVNADYHCRSTTSRIPAGTYPPCQRR